MWHTSIRTDYISQVITRVTSTTTTNHFIKSDMRHKSQSCYNHILLKKELFET
jgi:hypothetical protein